MTNLCKVGQVASPTIQMRGPSAWPLAAEARGMCSKTAPSNSAFPSAIVPIARVPPAMRSASKVSYLCSYVRVIADSDETDEEDLKV